MKKITLISFILIFIFLSGCVTSAENDLELTEEFNSAVETAIVETNASSLPINENTPTPPPPTLQPTATSETPPTQEPTPVAPTPTPLPTPCYRAELVEETVPDGTKFTPGKWFSKIWIVKNTGVCEWTEEFRWVLVDGEDFSGVTDVTLNQNILPGEDLKVLLELRAPSFSGGYKGTYQILTDEGGSVTPLGFWVAIVVE